MKKDAVVKLNRMLQETTGVSLFQFDKEVIHSQMNDLICFPKYAYQTILSPVLVLFGFIVMASVFFFAFDLYIFAAVFFILGIIFSVVGGLALGIVRFISKCSEEMQDMLVKVLRQVKFVLMEISIADEDYLETYLDIPPLEDVVRGMSQIICLSSIEKQVYKHLPYFPELIFRTIYTVYSTLLDEVAHRIIASPTEMQTERPRHATGQINTLLLYSSHGLSILDTLIRDKKELINRGKRGIILSAKLIGGFTCAFLGLLAGIVYLLTI